MTKDEKIIFYDPSGCKRNRVPKFFDTVRYSAKRHVSVWMTQNVKQYFTKELSFCSVYIEYISKQRLKMKATMSQQLTNGGKNSYATHTSPTITVVASTYAW